MQLEDEAKFKFMGEQGREVLVVKWAALKG